MKKNTTKPRYWIGIDPGVNTGFAIWDSKERRFTHVETGPIHKWMTKISWMNKFGDQSVDKNIVIVEDARKRKHDPGLTPEKAQGAGSVKRDCKIWEDFLTELGVNFKMVAPNGKLNAIAKAQNLKLWQANCKWAERTTEHARVAAMLVWNS